jgi:lipoprotein Spr
VYFIFIAQQNFVRCIYRYFLVLFMFCQSAHIACCQQLLAGNIVHEPQFISGFSMTQHQKSDVITDIIVTKPVSVTVVVVNPQTNVAGIKDGSIVVVKDISIEVKDTIQSVAIETDSTENKDTATVALAGAQPVQIKLPDAIGIASHVSAGATSDETVDPLIAKYAEMISLDPTEISNYPLYHFIEDWYGVRYRWGGEDNTGIDCSAFSQKLYGKVYGKEMYRTVKEQHKKAEKIKDADDAEEGDLVFFRIHHLRVSHVGVYLANGYFVHASRTQGVVISNLSSKYWHRRYAGCGRVEKEDKAVYESDTVQ